MKIFISWSGETSQAVAKTLEEWIPSVIQAVETIVSPEEIRKGTGWVNDVSKEMNLSSLAILCVVPNNIGTPWLNFEAGVLLKTMDISKVIPLLIDVEKSDLGDGPLAQFPSAIFDKKEMVRILETINENMGTGNLNTERLRNTFEVWWPKLVLDVESIMRKETDGTEGAEKLENIAETEKPEMKSDAKKPEGEPDRTVKAARKSGAKKSQDPDQPEETPNVDTPDKKSAADQPEETPERPVKPAINSETKKTKEPGKPKKPVAAEPLLEEMDIELLKALYEPPGYTPRTAADVGYKLDISASKVKEHLDILERRNYVREHLYVGRAKEFSLAPKGRDYLTKHDLLK